MWPRLSLCSVAPQALPHCINLLSFRNKKPCKERPLILGGQHFGKPAIAAEMEVGNNEVLDGILRRQRDCRVLNVMTDGRRMCSSAELGKN